MSSRGNDLNLQDWSSQSVNKIESTAIMPNISDMPVPPQFPGHIPRPAPNGMYPIPGMMMPGMPSGMPAPGMGFMPGMIPPFGMPNFPRGMPLGTSMPNLGLGIPPVVGLAKPSVSNANNSSTSTNIGDPNNDASLWAEHSAPSGQKYWYNSVSLVSTYEKPFCLKTPEERSLPTCEWKEYAIGDGRVYYSNGKESSWTMPEEFKVWKERLAAIEQAKQFQLNNSNLAINPIANKQLSIDINTSSAPSTLNQPTPTSISQASTPATTKSNVPAIQYASLAEAQEAFKELLASKNVSSTAKMKEVQDMCQSDPRWDALRTQGEKKQALAEYQTKRLKEEKEQQKLKQRKHRDSFLLMLAENTSIDTKTKWRDAVEVLKSDIRFKNIESASEREDLFHEFINELQRKDREDIQKHRQKALEVIEKTMKSFPITTNNVTYPIIDPYINNNWAIYKQYFEDIRQRSDLKILNENDCKQVFFAYLREREIQIKKETQFLTEEYYRTIDKLSESLQEMIKKDLVLTRGYVNIYTRYKQFLNDPIIYHLPLAKELCDYVNQTFPKVIANPIHSQTANPNDELARLFGRIFDTIKVIIEDLYKEDKKCLKKFLHSVHYRIEINTSFDDFKSLIFRYLRLKDQWTLDPLSQKFDSSDSELPLKILSPQETKTLYESKVFSSNPSEIYSQFKFEVIHDKEALKLETEEGEEIEEGQESNNNEEVHPPRTNGSLVSSTFGDPALAALQSTILSRPHSLHFIYLDMLDKVVEEYETNLKHQKKAEDNYLKLLQDYFYLSDHVGISWEDAKLQLSKRSAYENLSKHDRKRLFEEYMSGLSHKLEAKANAMRLLSSKDSADPNLDEISSKSQHRKRERSIDNNDREFQRPRDPYYENRDREYY